MFFCITTGVSKGSWYWEAKITDLPEGAATRIGWSQSHSNLQAPLGFDKFGYSWRSRYGTKFHEAIGRSYCRGGYTTNDVLGFLIILPQLKPKEHCAPGVTPLVPESYKDRVKRDTIIIFYFWLLELRIHQFAISFHSRS